MSRAEAGTVWCRSKEVAFVDDGERVVLLALRPDGMTRPQVLYGPARSIWQALDGERSTLDIANAMAAATDASMERALEQTERFLQRLQDLGLANLRPDSPPLTYRQQEG